MELNMEEKEIKDGWYFVKLKKECAGEEFFYWEVAFYWKDEGQFPFNDGLGCCYGWNVVHDVKKIEYPAVQ